MRSWPYLPHERKKPRPDIAPEHTVHALGFALHARRDSDEIGGPFTAIIVVVPHAFVIALLAAPLALLAWRSRRARRRRSAGQCVTCGYDLRGSPAGRCPECGAAVAGGAAVSAGRS